jgi:hypothetical protein
MTMIIDRYVDDEVRSSLKTVLRHLEEANQQGNHGIPS